MINTEIGTTKETARTMLYQFLTLVFYEPTVSLYEDLKRQDNSKQLLDASRLLLGSQGEELMKNIFDAIYTTNANQDETVLDLRVEYTRLFIGPMTPPCSPYESVFDRKRSEENWGTMAGPTADAMANALADEGLELTLEYAELPDHVAIELEFMSYLLSRAYLGEENSEIYLEKADAFLKEHLAQWLPEFGTGVSQKSHHLFYQKTGLLLTAFINADLETVKSHSN